MKIKLIKILSCLVLFSSLLTSCVTTKPKDVDPNFLADMDPFEVGQAQCYTKSMFFKPKQKIMNVLFYPRFSGIALDFKDGMNNVLLVFDKDEFVKIEQSARTYVEMFDSDTLDSNHKPKSKNKLSKGEVEEYWGAVGLSRNVTAPFETNYEWLEVDGQVNPYFRIRVKPAAYPEEENVSSNDIYLYFSPSMLDTLFTLLDEDVIKAEIKNYNDAFVFN